MIVCGECMLEVVRQRERVCARERGKMETERERGEERS